MFGYLTDSDRGSLLQAPLATLHFDWSRCLLLVNVVAQKHLQTKKPKTCKWGFGEANQYDNMESTFELATSLLE